MHEVLTEVPMCRKLAFMLVIIIIVTVVPLWKSWMRMSFRGCWKGIWDIIAK